MDEQVSKHPWLWMIGLWLGGVITLYIFVKAMKGLLLFVGLSA